MSDRENDIAIYRLLSVPGLGGTALARVLRAWQQDPALIAEFWIQPRSEYINRWGLQEGTACFIEAEGDSSDAWIGARSAAARARDADIEALTVLDLEYEALATARGLPPVLFTRGNQDLLWRPGAAVVHSRDASEEALTWGAALAAALAADGMGLVSGHNRDGYRRVGAAAKRAGSPLTVVLDRPLHSTPGEGPRAEPVTTARLWDPEFRAERELIVSGLRPGDSWTPRHARARDALVVGIAPVVVAGDVRQRGIMAALCAATAAAGRPLLRSPFCRVEFDAPQLPSPIATATAMVIHAAGEALGTEMGATGARVGWLERRWEEEIGAFTAALEADIGSEMRVQRLEAGPFLAADSSIRRAWLRRGVRVVAHLPVVATERAEEVLVITGVAADPASPALLLAPGRPIRTLAELRDYLSRCRAQARSALKTQPSSALTAPGPVPPLGVSPSPQ
jgi:hypothetical protein